MDIVRVSFTSSGMLTRLLRSLSRLEAHYMVNKGFMPEGHLTSEDQLAKIRDIPCIIVHGRYDMICPVSGVV